MLHDDVSMVVAMSFAAERHDNNINDKANIYATPDAFHQKGDIA